MTTSLITSRDAPPAPREPDIRVRDLIDMLQWVDPDAYVRNSRQEWMRGLEPLNDGGRKVVVVR